MKKFICKPYKLYNKIQHYAWGTKNENAFIPKFLNVDIQKDVPYAELWIGTHPKASSEIEIDGKKIALDEIIRNYKIECLGEYVSKKFGGNFPFLLKVLSAANALSIQTHPNKFQAEKLHKLDPRNYPDDNHKPEIAIALDSLIAIAGFRPVKEIQHNLNLLPELKNFAEEKLIYKIIKSKNIKETEEYIKELYSNIMLKAEEEESLSECIEQIVNRLRGKGSLTFEESHFLEQYKLFGADVGLFSLFFFNIIELKPRQGIFTGAGVPHAYIKGNIVECMANSDNVVRAGLTNKFKDVKTLLEIMKYEFKQYDIINAEQKADEVKYKTDAEEFEITYYNKPADFNKSNNSGGKPSIYLVAKGAIEIKWNVKENIRSEIYSKGESLFIPAVLGDFEIFAKEPAEYFEVIIP
ncbi:MAG: mannose-6-phosphate isomerase, class I [Ignavibacteriaceae bacterium]